MPHPNAADGLVEALRQCADALKSGTPEISGDVTDYRLNGMTVYFALNAARAALAAHEHDADDAAEQAAGAVVQPMEYYVRNCPGCRALMQLRHDEGAEVRKIGEEIGEGFSSKHARLLDQIADSLECGNPLGDCGCEGTCFTGGDEG